MTVTEADQQLIRLLADGQFRSGSELGEALGISRAGIWKRMQRLTDWGLAVESVKGRGYRLASALQLLDADALAQRFQGRARFHYHWATGSTNADALALARDELPRIVVAEYQHAGRGRRGRQWQSPFAANLYLSVRFPLARGFSALGGLSLAVGVAVAEVLVAAVPGLDVGLKWPNDLLVGQAKLGGILVELAGEMDGQVDVVIGVGINGRMTASQAEQIDQRWTDLASHARQMPDRTALCGDLLSSVLAMLATFSERGFVPFMARFDQYDLCCGRSVRVQAGDQQEEGVARGVTEDGALRLQTANGERLLHGGEVSLRIQ
ncbi:biotin-[acetyl-CoA-carboxylase] ligase [Alcanivorax hongdengensis A-11-3]|uniref:Bifunctional ligase/repressor BirA n=1 Tax=Alcanivorax hongdengensis A-11-3 TaxID=1177179 RepID=L0W7U0_9GAMM|nr:bifunctional biotin--[acetyl-CoA-carboxylase] ligase/biotin operon repressor BirA [Alcanivorax hongdengensis]EKF72788.1 biotin-[acetyl-CoA-carboxylase] ligase [Alcanivorax hongdengensis A-11-3]